MSQSSPSTPRPVLIVTGGPHDGTEIAFEGPAEKVVGSGQGCDLRLELGNVEPRHGRLIWGRKGLLLTDLKTSTGTYVNGERIQSEHALQDGDRVCLGPPGSKGSAKLLARVPAEALAGVAEPVGIELAPESEPLVVLEPEPVVLESPKPTPPPAPAPRLSPPTVPPNTPVSPAAEAHPRESARTPVAASPPPPGVAPAPTRRQRPEFTDELPSIGGDRVREAVDLPPSVQELALRKVKTKKRAAFDLTTLPIPRPVIYAGVGLLALVAVFATYRALRRPTPVIATVSPGIAEAGGTITLSGTDFDPTPANNVVKVGDQAGQIVSASETQLVVTVPAGAKAGNDQPLTVESRGKRSNVVSLKVHQPPKVAALDPDVALPGQEVVARGEHLDGKPLSVTAGGLPAEVKEAQATSLRFRVPPEMPFLSGKSVPVVVQIGPTASRPASFVLGKLPLLIEVAPSQGQSGDRVTLKGRGFAPAPEGNIVSFGEQRAVVLRASPTELVVAAPSSFASSSQVQAPVMVQTGGAASSPAKFVLSRPSTGFFRPRYFPAVPTEGPGGDHVFVSTDLGPALLLSGKGDAASTAERAFRVAEALNKTVEAALTTPVSFEARDTPTTGVGLAGAPELLVTATAEDVAGYALPWDPAQRPDRRASPKFVAQYWAALLQDHVVLFIRRERPGRVMELSPRGKPLLELYAEAVRRGGKGAGVPGSAVSPLPGALARAFREMALLLPDGQVVAGAVTTGRWRGSMDVEGQGSRTMQVVLRLEGSRLVGTMSATSGKIGMDMPLTDVSYDKGSLKFVLVLGNQPRHFVGTLQGGEIAGSIFPSAGARDAVGRFSLQFVE